MEDCFMDQLTDKIDINIYVTYKRMDALQMRNFQKRSI